MIKLDKIGRELGRLLSPHHWGRKVALRLRQIYAHTVLPDDRIRFDLSRLGLLDGQALVCFVSYAPAGLRTDTKQALRLMQAKPETKVFLVSNGPMIAPDRAWLDGQNLPHAITANQGYDFGAYQKFVRSLLEADRVPERLVLMNDSFIFPLETQTLSPILEDSALGADFVGLIDQGRRGGRHRHFCSFYLSFSQAVVTSQPFRKFWRDLRPLCNRTYTIHFGEKGLSQTLLRAGFSTQTHFHKVGLIAAIKDLTERADRAELLEALAASDLLASADLAALQKSPWTEQVRQIIDLIQSTENLKLSTLYTRFCGMPFVKVRNLREEGRLQNWYAARYPVIAALGEH